MVAIGILTLIINIILVSLIKVFKKHVSKKYSILYEIFWAGVFASLLLIIGTCFNQLMLHRLNFSEYPILYSIDINFFILLLLGLINLCIILLISYLFKNVNLTIIILILQLQLVFFITLYELFTKTLQPIHLISFLLIFVGTIIPLFSRKRKFETSLLVFYGIILLIALLKIMHRFILYTAAKTNPNIHFDSLIKYILKENILFAAMGNPIDFEIELLIATTFIVFIYLMINKKRRRQIIPSLQKHWPTMLIITFFYLGARWSYLHVYHEIDNMYQLHGLISITTPTTFILAWLILKEKINRKHIVSVFLILTGTALALLFS